MSNYNYIQSERNLWTVGFYKPDGAWQSESDHDSKSDAAARTAFLNGNKAEPVAITLAQFENRIYDLVAFHRAAKGMSQKELCTRVDMTPATLSKFEAGKQEITTATLERIFKELNLVVVMRGVLE